MTNPTNNSENRSTGLGLSFSQPCTDINVDNEDISSIGSNEDRATNYGDFAATPNRTYAEMPDKSAITEIETFAERYRGWQLNIAKTLIKLEKEDKLVKNSGIAILNIVIPYFEMISNYQGIRASCTKTFTQGVKDVLNINHSDSDKNIETFYDKCRCGLFHMGMIRNLLIIKPSLNVAFDFNKIPVEVNPFKLVEAIEVHFDNYINELLRNPESEKAILFIAKYKEETETNKGEHNNAVTRIF